MIYLKALSNKQNSFALIDQEYLLFNLLKNHQISYTNVGVPNKAYGKFVFQKEKEMLYVDFRFFASKSLSFNSFSPKISEVAAPRLHWLGHGRSQAGWLHSQHTVDRELTPVPASLRREAASCPCGSWSHNAL